MSLSTPHIDEDKEVCMKEQLSGILNSVSKQLVPGPVGVEMILQLTLLKLTALLECHSALLILMRTKRCAWKSSCQEFWIQCQSNWYQVQLVLKWYCDWWETQEILLWVYPGQKYSQQLCPTLYLRWDAFLNVLASENFEKLWCYWVQMWWLWSRERKTCCPSIGSCRVRICVYSTVWSCICWWMQRTLW